MACCWMTTKNNNTKERHQTEKTLHKTLHVLTQGKKKNSGEKMKKAFKRNDNTCSHLHPCTWGSSMNIIREKCIWCDCNHIQLTYELCVQNQGKTKEPHLSVCFTPDLQEMFAIFIWSKICKQNASMVVVSHTWTLLTEIFSSPF